MQVGDRIDPAELIGQRWFAAPAYTITSIVVEERFEVDGGGALEILRVDVQGGRTLWRSMPIESPDGPSPWVELLALAGDGREIAGAVGGRLFGWPPRTPVQGPCTKVVPLGRDQSHTSVVIDDAVVLKLYRAIEPGQNPEVELGALLDEVAAVPVPRFRGAVWAHLPKMDEPFALAFVQDFVRDAGDLFEILAERLAAWLRAGAPPRALPSLVRDAGSIGDATAALHSALATLRGPSLAPRSGGETDLETWQHAADAARGKAMRLLGAVAPDQARWLARHATAIDDALSHLRPAGTLQRIHADLHLGQLLHSGGGLLIGDLEGEPTRPVSERRRLDTPMRDLASMLRSFDHVARSGMRRSGVPIGEIVDGSSAAEQAIDAWLASMRSAFLDAYAAEAAARAGELSVTIDPRLLHALEVEKELYEFGYAATYLPTWMYAPSAGMRWLLDHSPA